MSIGPIYEAKVRHIPVVFTLHDFWLACPLGNFIQKKPDPATGELHVLCAGQENRKCAERCYSSRESVASSEDDLACWTGWVAERMVRVVSSCKLIDRFLVPSRYAIQILLKYYPFIAQRVLYLDYGFDLTRLTGRQRIAEDEFVFGYIGTHVPMKGVELLIKAFGLLSGRCRLRIWGRHRPGATDKLKHLVNSLPHDKVGKVEWMGEYVNEQIVSSVFNHCDAIVVPSLWAEISPLVIHEALQTRTAVITANYGGMAELVMHNVNGLLFQHRNFLDLAMKMQQLTDNPGLAQSLGQRGYIASFNGNIPNIEDHASSIMLLYEDVIDSVTVQPPTSLGAG
jgi:glycosyltransferase involved in cell wall biosynthesis